MLTHQGLVKLLDYGFMLEIGTSCRSGIEKMPEYCSPQVKLIFPYLLICFLNSLFLSFCLVAPLFFSFPKMKWGSRF